ncbi:MAG: hypothetical protein RIB84_22915 [Sneathiellaceae bacterium]
MGDAQPGTAETGKADSANAAPEAGQQAQKAGGRRAAARPKPTRVQFRHKFFNSVKGGLFRRSTADESPGFAVTLGENEVLLSFPGIRREFAIEEGSADAEMLDLVALALDFVVTVKLGDPLPREILTGEASWEVTDRHRTIASQRVCMQMVTWISGEETLITDPDQLVQLADDPRTRERVNEAFEEAAVALGWGKDRKDDVVKLVEQLANELAYIEAIREEFARVSAMEQKIGGYRKIYVMDMSVLEEISSCERFMAIAVADYGQRLEQIDAQTGEIMALLKNAASGIRYIREGRDDLHRRMMAWQELLVGWESVAVKRGQPVEDLLRKSNRFLAPRFMPRDEWILMTHLQDKREPTTARIW